MAAPKSEGDSQSQYNQEVKRKCREKLIKHAVSCLTTERGTSVCVQGFHVGDVWIRLQEEAKRHFSPEERLSIGAEIEIWELLHKGHTQTTPESKKPSDLRVCYLAGDDPTNDLKVFIDNGVLEANVSAIEKDPVTLEKAEEAISDSDYKCIKLFNGDILDFFKSVEGDYDIIYYDACGSLPSARQKTLKAIGYIFQYNKLKSPGALITNFSFPPGRPVQMPVQEPEDKERGRIKSLSETYLKYRLLNSLDFQGEKHTIDKSVDILSATTDEDIYGDYITYQVIDVASLYIPVYRMLLARSGRSSPLWDQIFVSKDDFLKEVKLYDIQASQGNLVNNLESVYVTANESYLRKIGSSMVMAMESNPLCKAWLHEIFPDWMSSSLNRQNMPSMLLTHHLTCEESFVRKFANENFKKNCLYKDIFTINTSQDSDSSNSDADTHPDKVPSLCDVPDPSNATRLVGGLLYGQMAYPSFPVVSKLLRLRYTAKQRQMFSDVFIFDKCRYIFDQFPSVNRAYDALKEPKHRMVLLMALHGLRSQLKQICFNDFCNVVDMPGAIFHEIPQREEIVSPLPDNELTEEQLQHLSKKFTSELSANNASTSSEWMELPGDLD